MVARDAGRGASVPGATTLPICTDGGLSGSGGYQGRERQSVLHVEPAREGNDEARARFRECLPIVEAGRKIAVPSPTVHILF